MGKAAISDITTTENTEDDNASDGDYSVETDATEILITDTIVNADNDEITIDPEVTNYYTPIQDGEISNDNDETHEIDETISLHEEARGSNEEPRPDEAQLSNGNDNSIPSVETISNNAQLIDDNDTTKSQEVISDEPTPDVAAQTRPRWLATYVHPVTGARGSRYTGSYSYAMAAFKHIDYIRKLTKNQVSHTGLIQYIGKDPVNANGFGQYINHMLLLAQYGISKGL